MWLLPRGRVIDVVSGVVGRSNELSVDVDHLPGRAAHFGLVFRLEGVQCRDRVSWCFAQELLIKLIQLVIWSQLELLDWKLVLGSRIKPKIFHPKLL